MNASSPYNPNPAADVVLRTGDNMDFYVIGPLLRFVSPVFMDMFTLSRGPAAEENEKKGDLPLIRLEEDSETLRFLLDIIYPRSIDPPLTDVSLFWKVGKASKKYIMDVVEGKLQHWIVSSNYLITAESLRIYAIAIDLGWETVAIEAARKTLGTPFKNLGYVEELRSIPASGYYRFLEYRLRCDTSSSPQTETLMTLPHEGDTGETTTPPAQVLHPPFNTKADTPTGTPAPFASSKGADLIIRSSDFVDFFVLKSLIQPASPELDQVFSRHKMDDGKILIHVTQDSKVLHQLLSLIYYYIDEADISDFQLLISVAEAARECKMPIIEKRLRRLTHGSPLIVKEPLKIYILATVLRWDDVAKLAALNTLSLPLQEMAYVNELNRITGEDLYRLVNFRFRCGETACESLTTNTEFTQYGPSNWRGFWPNWTINGLPTMEDLKEKIKTCPRGSALDSIYTSAFSGLESGQFISPQNSYNSGYDYYHRNTTNVNINSPSTVQVANIMKCYKRIGDTIEEAVSKVPFEFL